jgi:hypothetical protein
MKEGLSLNDMIDRMMKQVIHYAYHHANVLKDAKIRGEISERCGREGAASWR